MCGHKLLCQLPDLPSPELWGWTATDSGWKLFQLNNQRLPSTAMSCYILTVRRDATGRANVTSQFFNEQSYVATGGHVVMPDLN